jgi:hypothetical protein
MPIKGTITPTCGPVLVTATVAATGVTVMTADCICTVGSATVTTPVPADGDTVTEPSCTVGATLVTDAVIAEGVTDTLPSRAVGAVTVTAAVRAVIVRERLPNAAVGSAVVATAGLADGVTLVEP